MLHKFLLAFTASTALTGAAMAADLPSPYKVVPPPIPLFTWTGFYVGGQIGYEFGRDTSSLGTTAASPTGVIGGIHGGYNYQFPASNFVLGLEGDVEGARAKSSTAYPGTGFAGVTNFYNEGYQWSVRGRLGYAAGRALFYATGGFAYNGITNNYFDTIGNQDASSRNIVGYTVGGGVDYAITDVWSIRAEYRYTDFGKYADYLTNTTGGVPVTRHDSDNKVEAGFSYRFGGPVSTPVVARY